MTGAACRAGQALDRPSTEFLAAGSPNLIQPAIKVPATDERLEATALFPCTATLPYKQGVILRRSERGRLDAAWI